MRIAAIVVTYNRKELLLNCIECLSAQQEAKTDIIIIDNNSSDGTQDSLKALIEAGRIKYYNTGANLGGAGGFQYGIRKAVGEGYDYIWMMDDDCMTSPTALAELLNVDQKLMGKYGFLSSKALWKDGSLCKMNIQRHPMTKNISDFSEDIIPAEMASFVSLFIRAEVVRELGLPIKEFFIWTDDWEYTRRISLKYPCYVVTKSVVTHKSKANLKADVTSDSADRLDRYRYLYRNDVYLYRREGFKGFIYELVRVNWLIFKVFCKAKDNKLRRVGMIIKGTFAGLRFNPQIEYLED